MPFPKQIKENIVKLKNKGFINIREEGADMLISFTDEGFFLMDSLVYEMIEYLIGEKKV